MRKENRKRNIKLLSTFYIVGVLLIAIVTFIVTFITYSNKLDNDLYSFESEYLSKYSEVEPNEKTEIASSEIGKNVEESKKIEESNMEIEEKNTETSVTQEKMTEKKIEEIEKEPQFVLPVKGEVSKEYAKDSLVYSETLKEWTIHLGIDIKAEKATVVTAAESGKVKYIKNDPRYGLTIIIEHSMGYQTLYANLLTTEFVSEGEEVEQGQTIATVGDSSVYEVVDEPHLHFEISRNGENLNPNDYIKFE